MDNAPEPNEGLKLASGALGTPSGYVDSTSAKDVDGRRRYYAAILHVIEKHAHKPSDDAFFEEAYTLSMDLCRDPVVVAAGLRFGITRNDAPTHARALLAKKPDSHRMDIEHHVFKTIFCVDCKVMLHAWRAARGYVGNDLVGT